MTRARIGPSSYRSIATSQPDFPCIKSGASRLSTTSSHKPRNLTSVTTSISSLHSKSSGTSIGPYGCSNDLGVILKHPYISYVGSPHGQDIAFRENMRSSQCMRRVLSVPTGVLRARHAGRRRQKAMTNEDAERKRTFAEVPARSLPPHDHGGDNEPLGL